MKSIVAKINNALNKIRLVDRFLIIIMAILLIQSVYTLFVHETVSQEENCIDIIVRTSAAAIFGYFLSGNFTKQRSSLQNNTMAVSETFRENDTPARCNKLQITVISVIGIVSLICLLLLRNFSQMTPQTASTVSQLRDFISASVGFLVSCGKKE